MINYQHTQSMVHIGTGCLDGRFELQTYSMATNACLAVLRSMWQQATHAAWPCRAPSQARILGCFLLTCNSVMQSLIYSSDQLDRPDRLSSAAVMALIRTLDSAELHAAGMLAVQCD